MKKGFKLLGGVFVLFIIFGIGNLVLKSKKSPEKGVLKTQPITQSENMKIESTAFKDNEYIPTKYTCDGENVNPPLKITDIPDNAKSLVLIVDDPDAPSGVWVHWVVWNINPTTTEIPENVDFEKAMVGKNDFGKSSYGGPCPPAGPTHRYNFKIYALDSLLDLPPASRKEDIEKEMEGHIVKKAILTGLYKR